MIILSINTNKQNMGFTFSKFYGLYSLLSV